MKPAIEVKGVWKAYHKGVDRRYKSLRDALMQWPTQIWRDKQEQFWALQDISFDVEHGQSIGIIGRNGAGKSTLLKILSRITPPTKGEVVLRGRVASLLEVGTGFHPELTGRENIFFNGSILGMKYAETKRKLDEIVDFSGVESFIDTPLKHYSSGMQMRLAFSVAAHLDAEILLIDEVLAVGDIEFHKKSMGKMNDISRQNGKTILFVSHNLTQIRQLTTRSLLLDQGTPYGFGNTDDIINDYYNSILAIQHQQFDSTAKQSGDIIFKNCEFVDDIGKPIGDIATGQSVHIRISVQNNGKNDIHGVNIGLLVRNLQGNAMTGLSSNVEGVNYTILKGENIFICRIDKFPLSPGQYTYNLIITKGSLIYNWMKEAGSLTVTHGYFFESGEIPSPGLQTVLTQQSWEKL